MKVGQKTWVIMGGHIPPISNGREPENTSRDMLTILNTTDSDAHLELTIFYGEQEPIGPYKIEVLARRIRTIRFNDLIDPQPIPLAVDYACVVESNVPVVVKFSRFDSSAGDPVTFSTMALPID
jgi:hypothetical protein